MTALDFRMLVQFLRSLVIAQVLPLSRSHTLLGVMSDVLYTSAGIETSVT